MRKPLRSPSPYLFVATRPVAGDRQDCNSESVNAFDFSMLQTLVVSLFMFFAEFFGRFALDPQLIRIRGDQLSFSLLCTSIPYV